MSQFIGLISILKSAMECVDFPTCGTSPHLKTYFSACMRKDIKHSNIIIDLSRYARKTSLL